MWLVVVGVMLLVLKLMGLGGVGGWSWWLVLAPFAAAVLWWQISDSAGWTQRAAMRRQEVRVQRRRDERLDALGLRRTPQRSSADKDPTRHDAAAAQPNPRGEAQAKTPPDKPTRPPVT